MAKLILATTLLLTTPLAADAATSEKTTQLPTVEVQGTSQEEAKGSASEGYRVDKANVGPLGKATLQVHLVSPGVEWQANVTDRFPVPVDPKYATGEVTGPYLTGKWHNHSHLTLESTAPAAAFTVYAVLYPERTKGADGTRVGAMPLQARVEGDALVIARPDGRTDTLVLTDTSLSLR